jgi:hypothetical protein
MNSAKKARFLYNLAIVFGLWFLLFGWFWSYLVNLVIAYPFGIAGFILWYFAQKLDTESKLNKFCIRLLLTGLFLSVFTFFMYR